MPFSEKSLISALRGRVARAPAARVGIGDDCAVLRVPHGHEVLLTTDFSLEGVHFRRDWHSPEVVGHRCLTRGFSDIAAMGGEPLAVFLSLALPFDLAQSWVNRFIKGLISLAGEFNAQLSGGDTAQSPSKILADIVVIGSAPKAKAILRSGARPGDIIYVTGKLGGSAAALKLLLSGKKLRPVDFPQHFRPMPRIEVGRALRERHLASAMIDISDGLSTDLSHLCEESGVGAEVDARSIPLAIVGRPGQTVDRELALHGGDEYELLFTAPKRREVPEQIAGVPVTPIGAIQRDHRVFLVEGGRRSLLKPEGWQHFSR